MKNFKNFLLFVSIFINCLCIKTLDNLKKRKSVTKENKNYINQNNNFKEIVLVVDPIIIEIPGCLGYLVGIVPSVLKEIKNSSCDDQLIEEKKLSIEEEKKAVEQLSYPQQILYALGKRGNGLISDKDNDDTANFNNQNDDQKRALIEENNKKSSMTGLAAFLLSVILFFPKSK